MFMISTEAILVEKRFIWCLIIVLYDVRTNEISRKDVTQDVAEKEGHVIRLRGKMALNYRDVKGLGSKAVNGGIGGIFIRIRAI